MWVGGKVQVSRSFVDIHRMQREGERIVWQLPPAGMTGPTESCGFSQMGCFAYPAACCDRSVMG